MKHFAKLVLFFTLAFAGVLFLAGFLTVLQDRIDALILFPPPGQPAASGGIAVYLKNALPAALYLSILLALNYSARRRMAYPAVFAVLLVLAVAVSGAAFFALAAGPGQTDGRTAVFEGALARPGLILSPAGDPFGNGWGRETETPLGTTTQTVFLDDPYKAGSARAVSRQGSLYFEAGGAYLSPVRLPFSEEKNFLFQAIRRDLKQSALFLSAWFDAGLLSYAVYAGSLAVLLLSLGCLVNISFWSLANLFFAALAFRGVLALEAFLNQSGIHELLSSFAGNIIAESLINPVIFTTLGALILIYSALVYLARGKTDG